MRIRMITTAAGPNGVWPAGSVQRVDQETGETLIRYGFAEAVDAELGLDALEGRETATAVPAMERAVDPVAETAPKPAPRRTPKAPAKKSTK